MQNSKLNTVVNEINEFIKNKVGLLLNDLLVQSNEYEETKAHILKLPFIQQIISELVVSQLSEQTQTQNTNTFVDYTKIKIEECEIREEIKDLFFNIDTQETPTDSENIFLKIEETNVDEECNNDDVILLPNEPQEHVQIILVDEELSVHDVLDEEKDSDDNSEQEQEEEEVETTIVVEDEKEEETDDVVEDEETDDDVVEEEETDDVVVEEEDEEEEEDGVFEIEINGTTYFTNNEKNGTIYSVDENGDPDEEVGNFVNGKAVFAK